MTHYDPIQINYRALGQMVQKKRSRDGLTLRELADLIHVSASTLCRIERGLTCEPSNFFALIQYVEGTDMRQHLPAEVISG